MVASKTHSYKGVALTKRLHILSAERQLTLNEVQEDTSESNTTHSSTSAGKLINISIPTIIRSYDTISVSASSGWRCIRLL